MNIVEALRESRKATEAGTDLYAMAEMPNGVQYIYRLVNGEWEEAKIGEPYYSFFDDELVFFNRTGWSDQFGMLNVAWIETAQCRVLAADEADALLRASIPDRKAA